MKRVIVLFSAGMLVLFLTACGNNNNQGQQNQASGETSGLNQTDKTGGNALQTDQNQGNLSGSTAFAGPDENGNWSDEMQAVKQALVETLGENYWPDTAILPEMLEETYGISADMYEDYFAEMPMTSTDVDTIILVKSTEEQVEAVEEAMNAYRDRLVNDTMQHPMNLNKIHASRIERFGNYVCFVQLGADITDVAQQGDEEVIQYCQEQNELAIAVMEQNVRY